MTTAADYSRRPLEPAVVQYVQRNQPPGVPPLELTGERTLPDVPEENYWFRRHLAVVHAARALTVALARTA